MKSFLAYFDLLGYKNFIQNNTAEYLKDRTDHFARNIEMALALDHPAQCAPSGRLVSDISHSRLNCLTFSDTVIFWTNGTELEDFEEIVQVAFKYNAFNVRLDFPNRGCIVYGEIDYKAFDSNNQRGGRYMLNMIYGQALIDAHLKAEAMSWAGCVIDESALRYAGNLGDCTALLNEHTLVYDVPYKSKEGGTVKQEAALRLIKGEIPISEHHEKSIRSAFTKDNKGNVEGRVKEIFDNTVSFLKSHRVNFPFYYQYSNNVNETTTIEIFGKLQEDWTHMIVTRHSKGKADTYEIREETFDPDKSDRSFLDAEKIDAALFKKHFDQAMKNTKQ